VHATVVRRTSWSRPFIGLDLISLLVRTPCSSLNAPESGPSLTYTYNEEGERTKTKPSTGPATSYGYDQAGNLP
jgi:hypothetical protein